MDDRLTKLQWTYLENNIKASKFDYYTKQRISLKGKFVEGHEDVDAIDAHLKEWVLKEVQHGALGTKPFRCHCGKAIRHLYVVEHTHKDIELHLGSTCYKSYVGIDAEVASKVLIYNEDVIAERNEIIEKYDVGYIERQKFLLDYDELDKDFRSQLLIGLPLSKKQEDQAYKALGIEDLGALVKRRDIIGKLSRQQLIRMNNLTTQGRKTIIARLVDGRILGVLDQVLEAAPELFAVKGIGSDVGVNRLEERLINNFRQAGNQTIEQRIVHNYEAINTLIQMEACGLVEGSSLVKVASELLSGEQREYWRGHTSSRQKRELSKYLLVGMNRVELEALEGYSKLPRDIVGQVTLGLPLTEAQLSKLNDRRMY